MRASTIPLLDNEPLVVIRASFLALCDGDHCAAALLNNFVYWHDWCVTHGRYDTIAAPADPDYQLADPERWFWKTTEGLVNDDLLNLWGEKKVRAATERLESKGYAQSRSTRRTETFARRSTGLFPIGLPGTSRPGPPRTAENRWARQNGRLHPAKMPNVRTQQLTVTPPFGKNAG